MNGLATQYRPTTVRCARCGRTGEGAVIDVALGDDHRWRWLIVPLGWAQLLGVPDPHTRCPDCIPRELGHESEVSQ